MTQPREFLEIQAPDRRWWQPWASRTQFLRQTRGLWREVTQLKLKENVMANADRELMAALVAGLSSLGPAIDSLSSDRDSWRERALNAEGAAATDEAGDVAAAQPVKDLVDSLLAKVTPAAPDVADQPTPSPEEATEVVNAAPDPAPADGDVPPDAPA